MNSDVAQRSFDEAAQRAFADLSGDHNPIHLNYRFARRTQIGRVIVHGVHLLLWALESASAAGRLVAPIRSLEVRFLKPVYLCETATVAVNSVGRAVELQVRVADILVMVVTLRPTAEPLAVPKTDAIACEPKVRSEPADRGNDDLSACAGAVRLASQVACRATFPSVASLIGTERVAALLGISRIVGMECPGLHSLLSSVTANLVEMDDDDKLRYVTTDYDRRFCAARISAWGGRLCARIEAFSRPPPTVHPSTREVAARVALSSFASQCALVIGGSRGLGEVTAKVVAAGGGRTVITYATGRLEAEAVADDIRAWGGNCTVLRYDVRGSPTEQLAQLGCAPTHAYYFATPQIFRRTTGRYDPDLFREFALYYVDGFASVCETLSTSAIAAFYPSTIAVVESNKGLSEYAMAKAAGEKLCADLQAFRSNLRLVVKRLPRTLTDQTATVALVEAKSAADVMIPIVAEMQQQGAW